MAAIQKKLRQSFQFIIKSQRTAATCAPEVTRDPRHRYQNNNKSTSEVDEILNFQDFKEQSKKNQQKQQNQKIGKLRKLRESRKAIESEFLKLTTRLNYIKKKESQSIRNAVQAKRKVQSIFMIKNIRNIELKIKQDEQEKRRNDQWKKNQEVQSMRQSLQMNKKFVIQVAQSRKSREVLKFKNRHNSELKDLKYRKEQSMKQNYDRRSKIVQMHSKQEMKRKLHQFAKKLCSKDNIEQKIDNYERQTSRIYNLIQKFRNEQKILVKQKNKQQQIFKNIIQDIEKIKNSPEITNNTNISSQIVQNPIQNIL